MKEHLVELVMQALLDVSRKQHVELPQTPEFAIDRTRQREHGDFATNAALVLCKQLGMKPRDLAQAIVDHLPPSRHVEKLAIAGPGFINFTLTPSCLLDTLDQVLERGAGYGHAPVDENEHITLEYVSANPTGPLHVGHGRGAAFGASLSNILEASGLKVQREYYVNDYGRQMDILATSVWLRYLELTGNPVRFPDNGYKGDYVVEVAHALQQAHGDRFRQDPLAVCADLPADESQGGDKEAHVDGLINRARQLLGPGGFDLIYKLALERLLDAIREELLAFNVRYDNWFSERSLNESGAVNRAIERLTRLGHMYEEKGAMWFRATTFGDEKDRVVIRENGQTTYFASDIAYLLNKFERGFTRAVYVLGADHHGYIARLKAAASGLGLNPANVEIVLVQFAKLYKDGKEVSMGKREGNFVTLKDLRTEVGTDAARFFYVMRSHEQHLDFDLELAKSQSKDNPVYYVQYAHARIASVFHKLAEQGQTHDRAAGEAARAQLDNAHELDLMNLLQRFPETIEKAGELRAPHLVANYLRELAAALHGYYDGAQVKILVDDDDLRNARLNLLLAVKQVLANGLKLIGVSAPEKMERQEA
ncbi:MAG: arginine--tRNA ligase [Rhodanobacteraceae bacterium]|nr:arginine--tRNA ligase [Rhodanobacteraceae bacterium]